MVGKQIDFLFVKGRAPDKIDRSGRHRIQYLCDCACGNKDILRTGENLRSSRSIHSCGCIKNELIRDANTKHGDSHRSNWNRLYRIWSLMKNRCNNQSTPAYKDYGLRGICVCDQWKTYENFRSWAYSNGYDDCLTIDRIDVNGNYCPENCRWIPMASQSGNRRYCHYVTIGNETHHLSEWGRIYHIRMATISARIKAGWDSVQAITTPVAKRSNNAIV